MATKIETVQLSADGLAITGRFYLRQVCVSHKGNTDVTVDIYDKTTAPAGGDVPHCQVPALGKGVSTIPVPDPGILFLNGAYVDLPADTSVVLFYEEA